MSAAEVSEDELNTIHQILLQFVDPEAADTPSKAGDYVVAPNIGYFAEAVWVAVIGVAIDLHVEAEIVFK